MKVKIINWIVGLFTYPPLLNGDFHITVFKYIFRMHSPQSSDSNNDRGHIHLSGPIDYLLTHTY